MFMSAFGPNSGADSARAAKASAEKEAVPTNRSSILEGTAASANPTTCRISSGQWSSAEASFKSMATVREIPHNKPTYESPFGASISPLNESSEVKIESLISTPETFPVVTWEIPLTEASKTGVAAPFEQSNTNRMDDSAATPIESDKVATAAAEHSRPLSASTVGTNAIASAE